MLVLWMNWMWKGFGMRKEGISRSDVLGSWNMCCSFLVEIVRIVGVVIVVKFCKDE